ncbi:PAR15 polymerase, partial [Nothoprocta pentlandii]|nr:PAR15 polymerase [Nothoprocta pentlandii]
VILFQTDVVVNSIGVDLQLGVGPLCRALLQKAGPELQLEFDQEKQKQAAGNGTVFHTSGYNLLCKTVLHAVVPLWDGGSGEALKILKDIINFCLHKTEELALNSITFPAIGTGGFAFPKSTVAKLMFDTVFKFSSHHSPKTLREVHFLLYPKDAGNIQVFLLAVKSSPKLKQDYCKMGFFLLLFFLAAFIGPVVSYSPGVHEMKIGSITLQLINGDITKEDTDVIVNIASPAFKDNSGISLNIIIICVSFVFCRPAWQLQRGFITTEGGNLLCKKIIHLIHSLNIKKQVTQVLQECELQMYTSVAFPAIGTGKARQSPAKVADNMLDAIIEFARQKAVLCLKIIRIVIFETKMNSEFYESMKKRQELHAHDSDRDESKLTCKLAELPAEWEDMKDKQVLVVNLLPTSQEYQDVEKEFQKTCPNFTIEKIERVQNPSLWQTYQIKKGDLDKKNKGWMNERLLFHGTAAASLSLINYRGFDRGFAGKNAAMIGNGTYFAVRASYSAQDTYSRPDSSDRKHMYLARVLTGQYCAGRAGLVTAPAKNTADTADRYDSVVDNVNSPNVFVIFSDIQAYPQHLITFRK